MVIPGYTGREGLVQGVELRSVWDEMRGVRFLWSWRRSLEHHSSATMASTCSDLALQAH